MRIALSSYPDVPAGLLGVGTTVTTVTTAKLSLSYVSQGLAVRAIVLGLLRLPRRR